LAGDKFTHHWIVAEVSLLGFCGDAKMVEEKNQKGGSEAWRI